MKELVIFFLLRLADLITTYLAMAKYGGWADIEAIPFNAWLIEKTGFFSMAGFNLIISSLLFLAIWKVRRIKFLFPLVCIIISGVVINNLLVFLLI